MFATVVALVLGMSGVTDQEIIDAIVKARIELAKNPVSQVDPYTLARRMAISENRPLLVLVGGSEVKQCTDTGCKPIPSNWLLLRVPTFDLGKGVIKSGIIVSRPTGSELYYLDTVTDQTYVDVIANLINPVAIQKGHWTGCPTCPGGVRWVQD